MELASHVIKQDRLGISVTTEGVVQIDQRRIGGTEAWVSVMLEDLKKMVELAEKDLNEARYAHLSQLTGPGWDAHRDEFYELKEILGK